MEDQPPLPPVSTHPLFKNAPTPQQQQQPQTQLNYSSSEAPKSALYQAQQQQQQKQTSNPWDREEREKEMEMRREQVRLWRDQQIVELSLLQSRTQQQEEQLKTLVLERDFERRALEEENEEENEVQYQKNMMGGVQEVLRLQPTITANSSSSNASQQQITAPTTRLKQVDIKTTPTNISPSTSSDLPSPSLESISQQQQQQLMPPPVQPKSILKSTNNYNNSNPSSPSKHGKVTSFAPKIDTKTHNLTEITMNNTNANQMITQLGKELNELSLDYNKNDEINIAPPPPPERGKLIHYFSLKISSINFLFS